MHSMLTGNWHQFIMTYFIKILINLKIVPLDIWTNKWDGKNVNIAKHQKNVCICEIINIINEMTSIFILISFQMYLLQWWYLSMTTPVPATMLFKAVILPRRYPVEMYLVLGFLISLLVGSNSTWTRRKMWRKLQLFQLRFVSVTSWQR
jgi:hypothetical protein